MQWVTQNKVKIDRTASAWLIRRHIDPAAEFLFVERDTIPQAVAAGARPFHNLVVPGVARERSTFQDLLIEHGLDETDPALVLMGEAVRNAESAGWSKQDSSHASIWAIAVGNWSLSKDDAELVERLLPVYDAIYAFSRLRAAENSDWRGDH